MNSSSSHSAFDDELSAPSELEKAGVCQAANASFFRYRIC